jgi:hypothetical protein
MNSDSNVALETKLKELGMDYPRLVGLVEEHFGEDVERDEECSFSWNSLHNPESDYLSLGNGRSYLFWKEYARGFVETIDLINSEFYVNIGEIHYEGDLEIYQFERKEVIE